MSPPVNRRDRKKQATGRAIVAAALDLFAAQGYDEVTIERIADAADVAPRTVYRYFPTKAAIVFDVQASWMTVFKAAAANPLDGEPVLAELRRISRAVAAHVQANSAAALLAYRLTQGSQELQATSLSWEREWRLAVAAVAHTWERDRAIILAGMVMGMISAGLGVWLHAGASGDLVAMIDDGFDILERGWAGEGGAHPA
jgi:AcrR family transcriptional regulator